MAVTRLFLGDSKVSAELCLIIIFKTAHTDSPEDTPVRDGGQVEE